MNKIVGNFDNTKIKISIKPGTSNNTIVFEAPPRSKNLKILIGDIASIEELLDKKIDTIYLNFSDPWPKDRHAKRRLTSINYLQVYDKLFKGKPHIIQKTDNDLLFQFSLDEYQKYGYHINRISYDLHNEDIPNVMTEYEEKFSNMGIKIKYVDVSK